MSKRNLGAHQCFGMSNSSVSECYWNWSTSIKYCGPNQLRPLYTSNLSISQNFRQDFTNLTDKIFSLSCLGVSISYKAKKASKSDLLILVKMTWLALRSLVFTILKCLGVAKKTLVFSRFFINGKHGNHGWSMVRPWFDRGRPWRLNGTMLTMVNHDWPW